MRKLIGLFAILMIVSVAAGYPTYKALIEGRVKVPYGGPWIGDDYSVTFGNDKDVTVGYNATYDRLNIIGAPAYIADNLTVTGHMTSKTYAGSAGSAITTDTVYTAATLPTFVKVNQATGDVTVVLPVASSTPGRLIGVKSVATSGSNYMKINVTGGGYIDASTIVMSNTARAGITLFSDGTQYWIMSAYGSWS